MSTQSRDIIRLANLMIKKKKTEGTAPFVLVLGSDAAPLSMEEIEEEVLKVEGMTEQEIEQLNPLQKTDAFKQAWSRLKGDSDARFACLADSITSQMNEWEYQQKQQVYLGLANLIKYGYFDIVLTTNIDTFLEDALSEIGLSRRDYQILINGVNSAEQIQREISYRVPRIKILKLHGDLYSRVFAFSYDEVFQFSQEIETILKTHLSNSVLMVGKKSIDEDINRCIPAQGGNLYYVNADIPPVGTPIYNAIQVRNSSVICGEEGNFSSFFLSLSQQLLNLEKYSEVGVDITKISDEQAEAASQSDQPLVELLGEEDFETSKPKTEESLVELVDSTDFFVDVVDSTTFYIRYESNQRLSFGIEGKLQHESGEGEIIRLEPEDLNQMLVDMGEELCLSYQSQDMRKQIQDSWRRKAQREGKRLFKDLLAGNSSLMEKLGFARQAAGSEENLNLCFVGPRNYLGMPYELLYDTAPWAVRYPLCRKVTEVTINKQNFKQTISNLIQNQKPLKILLIASNTGEISPDKEIDTLAETIQQKADAIKLQIEIKKIPTALASTKQVEKLLEKCSYHIVHYAGHSNFDEATGENSGLIFYEHPKNRSGQEILTARALLTKLRDSETILFYLSSCVGATVAGNEKLRGSECLGIMDAIVQAGIPNVFGYRWYVTDRGAMKFACQFYESLLATRSPNQATLKARKAIYNEKGNDETWLSPILVVQNL